MKNEPERRWKFYAEDLDEYGFYLDEDNVFIGTYEAARAEANLRADDREGIHGSFICKITCESLGKVSC